MIVAKFSGSDITTAHGLTQWDYGQELAIECEGMEIPDGTEINFYQDKLSSIAYLNGNQVSIPDLMLQDCEMVDAYVYVRSESMGETILTIRLPIISRPKPDNYVLPDYTDYKRLLPAGGEPGQIPVKLEEGDYAIGWERRADGITYDGEYLQLMSGDVPVGERVRMIGGSGREVELTNDGEYIKWRYTDSNEWHNLASLDSLKGPPGVTPEFEIRDGHLIAKYNE